MNKAIQFLNKSLLFSICLHLIGVGIASLSIVGTSDEYGDAIVAEFVSLPKRKKLCTSHVGASCPLQHNPICSTAQLVRIQALTEVPHVQQNRVELIVNTLSLSAVHETSASEIDIADERALQRPLPPRLVSSDSPSKRWTPKRMSRPEWPCTSPLIASAQAAELPSVSAISNEPTQNARFFRKVDPIYPESARLSHKQGLVCLKRQ